MRNIVNQGEIMNATRKLISNARSCRCQRANPGGDGFTLTELLVVIATVGILAALILPALASTRPNSHAFQCLSNMKRLQMASQLYANDNNDYFPGNLPLTSGGFIPFGSGATIFPSWVAGTFGTGLNGSFDSPARCSTNAYFLGVNGDTVIDNGSAIGTLAGSIGGFAKAAGVYKCPADKTLDNVYKVPRIRSCSANIYCGADRTSYQRGIFGYDRRFKAFFKYSDFGNGFGPANCFVFLDENPLSLNDGYFEFIADGNGINDRPAVNHGRSTSFSFADGHTDLHQWVDAFLSYNSPYSPQQDPKWLGAHGTIRN